MHLGTLHYIYDPLCGWCYGAAPLLKAAAGVAGLQIRLHAGGMMAGERRQKLTPELRGFILQHDPRVAQLTGQEFGSAYHQGLLWDPSMVFDSEPPINATLAASEFGLEKEMLARIQRAHFVEGRKIADREVLINLGAELGMAGFEETFNALTGVRTQRHIEESRALLSAVGGAGFPTYAYGTPQGWSLLNGAAYLGKPDDWVKALTTLP
jgi:putative protein-disulfide isomerase